MKKNDKNVRIFLFITFFSLYVCNKSLEKVVYQMIIHYGIN